MLPKDPHWLLLPPFIRDRLSAKADQEGILPLNLTAPVLQRMEADQARAEALLETALGIHEHLYARLPGWGDWPTDLGDCLYIGLVLALWIEADLPELLLALPEEQLAQLEATRAREVCLEQLHFKSVAAWKN